MPCAAALLRRAHTTPFHPTKPLTYVRSFGVAAYLVALALVVSGWRLLRGRTRLRVPLGFVLAAIVLYIAFSAGGLPL